MDRGRSSAITVKCAAALISVNHPGTWFATFQAGANRSSRALRYSVLQVVWPWSTALLSAVVTRSSLGSI